MSPEDIPAGLRLSRAAGWNQLPEDWHFFLHSARSGGLVVEKENRIVGTVAFLRYDTFAWIAMMLVDPQERGLGLGAQLMEEALFVLSDAGCVGLDATPLGEPLYRRCGFVNEYASVRNKATIDASRFGRPTGGARRMNIEDLAAVLPRDREVFGADRGQLLTSLFQRAPEYAWIVKQGAAVQGYSFGRPGRLYHQLGPVVAGDRDTAQALVSHCLSEFEGKLFAIDAPRIDGQWFAWLESVGFMEERSFVRMFRHTHAHPGTPERQYAITGPEFA